MIANIPTGEHRDQEWLFKHIMPNNPRLRGTSVLQIGARGGGAIDIFKGFRQHGYNRFHVLEIWHPNVMWGRSQAIIHKVIHGDMRSIELYPALDAKYDSIIFWHGPEHLTKDQWQTTLPKVMAKCKAFIVGCPWGIWEQEDVKGNPHERHISAWYPEELERDGFNVYTFNYGEQGPGPDKHNVMMGIRYGEDNC